MTQGDKGGILVYVLTAADKQAVTVRTSQDYQTSDELRDQLKTLGIIIEDTPQGQRWHRAK
ncbi:hypothetical protein GQS40_12545|uniref:Cysteinyl-tRNA ligase anticodon binding domain-containing protein n=1 Tax=Leuconostoc lactis TaxID=1246 RepID=A0A6L7ABC9_LEULA|nr:hypothetical protein [Leuconostoc lactis]